MQQHVGHFLEAGLRRQIAHVIAAIGQAGAFLADGTQPGFSRHLAAQSGAAELFLFFHEAPFEMKIPVYVFFLKSPPRAEAARKTTKP